MPCPCPSPPSAPPTSGDPHVEEGGVCPPGECPVRGRRPRWGEGRKDGEGRGRGRPSRTGSETPRGCTGGPWRGHGQRALGVAGLLRPDQLTTAPRASGRDEGRGPTGGLLTMQQGIPGWRGGSPNAGRDVRPAPRSHLLACDPSREGPEKPTGHQSLGTLLSGPHVWEPRVPRGGGRPPRSLVGPARHT